MARDFVRGFQGPEKKTVEEMAAFLITKIPDAMESYLHMGKLLEEATRSASSRPQTAPAGRNDLCPCGSGRKFTKCCGAVS